MMYHGNIVMIQPTSNNNSLGSNHSPKYLSLVIIITSVHILYKLNYNSNSIHIQCGTIGGRRCKICLGSLVIQIQAQSRFITHFQMVLAPIPNVTIRLTSNNNLLGPNYSPKYLSPVIITSVHILYKLNHNFIHIQCGIIGASQ